MYVFYFMLFSFCVSLFALLNVKENKHILLLEVIITGISSLMYYLFSKMQNLHEIAVLRYNGWVITTPLMLTVLFLLNHATSLRTLYIIIGLDLLMLFIGYLGEIKKINKIVATILGFLPFGVLFFLLYTLMIKSWFNSILFGIYIIIWSGYGISYLFNEKLKNKCMSILDAIAKGVVSILLSIYFLYQQYQKN
jgi:hypothetical protein